MEISSFVPIILVLIIIMIQERNRKMIIKQHLQSKKGKEKYKMLELAQRFIGKECIVYTFNSQNIEGTISEVSNGAVLVVRTSDKSTEIVNADFIVRIREYPKNKNGKRKSVVLD